MEQTDTLFEAPVSSGNSPLFKVSIEKKILEVAMAHVQNVVEKRNTTPILSHVKIEAADECLIITATDMDLAIIEKIPAEVTVKSSMTVPAHKMYDIVKKLPNDQVIDMYVDAANPGQLLITAGQAKFNLSTLPAAEFPVLDKESGKFTLTVASSALLKMIDKTKIAISTDETRYYLNGIFFEMHGEDALRAVSTDCHRLAMYDLKVENLTGSIPNIIVPKKAIYELSKLLFNLDQEVKLDISESKITFTVANITLISKLIDGVYPNYNDAIPKNNNKILSGETAHLISSVDRVATIASDKFKCVKFSVEDNVLEINAHGEQNGYGAEKLVVSYNDEKVEIGFNFRYLLDIFNVISGPSLNIEFADSYSPAIIKDQTDPNALFVIMPMRY